MKNKVFGEKTLEILERISEGISNASDLLVATLTTPKGQQRDIRHKVKLLKRKRLRYLIEQQDKQRLRNLICKLKREGFIESDIKDNLTLTHKGLQKVGQLRDFLIRRKKYKKIKSSLVVIVAFDLPRKYNGYRYWLLNTLKSVGLRMLQKSVWIGKVKIPAEFINDLQSLDLLDFVQIISIKKSGTLLH